jgi:RNA polymerase sigma factor (sigma-70 family)
LFAQISTEEADPAAASSERDAIRRALAALPDGQREAVVLVEWLGMTDGEAGEVLGVSPGAVRVRLSRARAALREKLRGANDE